MLFKEIIGQQEIKNLLIQSVKEQRISHAQLFLGPEGCGNLAMAIAYAQYISCLNKTENDSCGNCSSCNKYNKLVHPDLHFSFPVTTTKEIDKHPVSDKFLHYWREAVLQNPYLIFFQWMEMLDVGNKQPIINAEECDEIVKKLSLKPFESEFKFMLIWQPEKLFHAAAPKLLKILEEPPDKTIFILISQNSEYILPTILSRTQLVKFGKLKNDEINSALVEKFHISSESAFNIAQFADGNYSDALQKANDTGNESFNNKNFLPWMRLCFSLYEKENMIKLIDTTEELSKAGRERQKNFLNYCLNIFRECLMLNYTGGALSKLGGEQLEEIRKFAQFVNEENCILLTEEFNSACADIERNVHPKTLFLDLSLKCAKLLKLTPA